MTTEIEVCDAIGEALEIFLEYYEHNRFTHNDWAAEQLAVKLNEAAWWASKLTSEGTWPERNGNRP